MKLRIKYIKGNAEKDAFRKTKEWKQFRLQLIKERGTQCECCLKKTKRLQLHHIDPEHYTTLDPKMFALLCAFCHKGVSDLEKIKPENRRKLRAEWYCDAFERFILNKVDESKLGLSNSKM